jgi:hypothetical protein
MNQPVLPSSSHEEHMLDHGFYNKHSHEPEKANTCGLPLIIEREARIPQARVAFIRRETRYMSDCCARSSAG